MDFQLQVPKDLALEIKVPEDRINDVIGSITMIRRSDSYMAAPVILQRPRGIQKSPKGTLLVEADAKKIQNDEGLQILSASADTVLVDVHKNAKVEDNEMVQDGAVYTRLQGTRTKLTAEMRKHLLDNSVLVNSEGVFLVNLIEPRDGPLKVEQKKGVKDTPSAEQAQLAQGAYLANTAR